MQYPIVESRVDWLTATARHDQGAIDLLNKGLEVVQANVDKGCTRHDWYFQGYRGTSATGASVGWRVDGCCIRLGGETAGIHWHNILPLVGHVSRIDFAVTLQVDRAGGGLARAAYRAAYEHKPANGRKAECSLVLSTRGGETAYIGRRISDRFLRVYNKHAESDGAYPLGSWRYEVEYKGLLAAEVAARLGNTTDALPFIAGTVHAEYVRQGVLPPFDPGTAGVEAAVSASYQTDNERRMRWLETQVRSVIERLSDSYSEEQILRALGIWYTQPMPDAPQRRPTPTLSAAGPPA